MIDINDTTLENVIAMVGLRVVLALVVIMLLVVFVGEEGHKEGLVMCWK